MKPPIHHLLKKYWGYPSFRPLQEDIIQAVLEGKDVLAILPTGGGKSICYQVPALTQEGICLVISPLIALMRDQVDRLRAQGIPALAVYSGMRYRDVRQTLQNAAYGNFKFLYLSPERLETALFLEFLPILPLQFIAVDEAHCISQWGYDFRPAYLTIASLREKKPDVPILALTASAPPAVQDDICEKLAFRQPLRFRQSFERPNLSYSVFHASSKLNKLIDILTKVRGSGIVYCRTRRRTREVAIALAAAGLNASHYHAGLSFEERNARQEKWKKNELEIMVCTNAFGMGIDKPDVRAVVHLDIPDCLESYYQEAGRAGRDGEKAYAVLLYNESDLEELDQAANIRFPLLKDIRIVYQALVNYLQLPAGMGQDQYFDFDIKQFCQRFRQDIRLVVSALKALEQEGLISYMEQIFIPSTVCFTASKESILDIEKEDPKIESLVKVMLRSYGGIIDQETAISELQIAATLRTDGQSVKERLLYLQARGILQYSPQKDKPQLRFLQNRGRAEDLMINEKNYRKRKRAFEKRIALMREYTLHQDACRSVLMAAYFTGEKLHPCGICDNCLKEKRSNISKLEFNTLVLQIMQAVETTGVEIQELVPLLKVQKDKAWKIIDFLVGEKKLEVDAKGFISSTKKKGQDRNPARF